MAKARKPRISEFARSIGVSHTAINKAIESGRIPPSLIATKKLDSGREVKIITDPVAARAAFAGDVALRESDGVELSSSSTNDDPDVADTDSEIPDIRKSRAIGEAYKAKLVKLEYEEKAGKLVNAEEVRTHLATMITTARTRLLGVPSKAKSRMPHLSIDDLGILTELIREALEGLADGH